MFCQNNYQMTVFSGHNQMTTTPKKKTKRSDKLRSRIEKQKELRYQMLSYRRSISSKEYGTPTEEDRCMSDGSDSDSGYSSGSRSSSFGFESYNFGELLTDLYSCQSLPQLETRIVAIVSRMTDLVINGNDISDDNNNGLNAIVTNLLSLEFLNKLSTFVGRKGLSFRVQATVLQLLEQMVKIEELSLQSIINLTTSSLVPKLFELLVDGNELLVKHSLSILMSSLEFDKIHHFMSHVLNCGFIDAIALRVDQLKCKSLVANSSDLKANRCQTLMKNNMSSMAKALYRHFSIALALMSMKISDLDVELKSQILNRMSPLLLRFLVCSDSKVIRNAVDILKWLTKNGNPTISFVIVESFGRILFQLTDKIEETIISSLLQLFEALISCCPQLSLHKSFASSLVMCLERIVSQREDNPKLDKEVIDLIDNISKLIVINEETLTHFSHRLLSLSFVVFQTKGRVSQLLAVSAIETLICKYSFISFMGLCKVFDITQMISLLIVSVNIHFQQRGLRIIEYIINILSESYDSMPEEVESVKHLLFGRSSDIYNCLNKLSFNTTSSLSSSANFLLNRIEETLGSGEDLSLLPQINDNGFVFALNF